MLPGLFDTCIRHELHDNALNELRGQVQQTHGVFVLRSKEESCVVKKKAAQAAGE
jgi:hypothetical protein